MSYGNDQWISPYTYHAILDARDSHPSAPARAAELRRAFALAAAEEPARRWEEARSPLSVDALDTEGQVLLTHHLLHVPSRGCCGRGGRGSAGVGLDLVVELGEGTHEIAVTAPDGLGGLLVERGILVIGG